MLTSQWLLCIHCFTSVVSFTGFYTEDEPFARAMRLKCAYSAYLGAIAVVLTTPERIYRKKNTNKRSELEGLFNWNNYALWITVAIARAVRAKRQRNVRFTRGSTQTAT